MHDRGRSGRFDERLGLNKAAGIALSGGPIRRGPAALGIVVRDPDRNGIKLHHRG